MCSCRSGPSAWLQRQFGHVEGHTPNGSEPRQGGERLVHPPEVISSLAVTQRSAHLCFGGCRPHLSLSAAPRSTILVCKCRIVDLFPKLETAVMDIKTAEAGVMQMQMKRQKEFWFLLKVACVSIRWLLHENFVNITRLLVKCVANTVAVCVFRPIPVLQHSHPHNNLLNGSKINSCLLFSHSKTFTGWKVLLNTIMFFFFSESVHQLLEENENYLSQLTSLLQETTQDPEYSFMVRCEGVSVVTLTVMALTVLLYL